jgi:hypothetical protein
MYLDGGVTKLMKPVKGGASFRSMETSVLSTSWKVPVYHDCCFEVTSCMKLCECVVRPVFVVLQSRLADTAL